MRFVLAAAFLGAIALVCIGTSAPAGSSQRVARAAQVAATPPGLASPVAQSAAHGHVDQSKHWTGIPAGQLHLHAQSSARSPVFLGRSPKSASNPGSPGPLTSVAAPAKPASPLVSVYNSLVKPGIKAADNGGANITPPDSTGAIGPNDYVEMANSVIHVWSRDLTTSLSATSLATFARDSTTTDPWCDPQVQWDQGAGRWLAMFSFCNVSVSNNSEGFVMAWSKTSDPSDLINGWCTFGFNSTPYLVDFPKLGHNSNYMLFGANLYDETTPTLNPPYVESVVSWVALPPNGSTSCPSSPNALIAGPLVNGDTSTAFTPVPVNTMTNTGQGYVVASYDVGNNVSGGVGPRSRLAVWHLDALGAFQQDLDVNVAPFSAPLIGAPQAGSTNLIDTLDGRLTSAIGDPVNGIWTQHTVAGGAGAMVAWYELTLSGGSLVLTQSGNVSSTTDFIFNGAISPSFSGQGAVVEYSRSSAAIDPVIAAQVRVSSTPLGQMEPGELVIASSSAADSDASCNSPTPGLPCRWGDYSAVTFDPVQPAVVWGTNEVNTATGSNAAWQDENFALWAAVPPRAPTINSNTAGDGSACVRFTPSAAGDGGVPDLSYTLRAYQGATLAKTVIVNAPASVGCITGLTDGTSYTVTVAGTNVTGTGAESAPSGPVTPLRGAAGSSSNTGSSRSGVNQSTPAPSPPTR